MNEPNSTGQPPYFPPGAYQLEPATLLSTIIAGCVFEDCHFELSRIEEQPPEEQRETV